MKKFLFVALLCFCGANLFGQSITVNDLINLTNLTNADAHKYLVLAKGFKKAYTQDVDGNTIEHLSKIDAQKKQESVDIGVALKLSSGAILRTVTYKTARTEQIFHLISQAKKQGLPMKFQGADTINNIYQFDNDFFHIVMYINRDNTSGYVEVKQKEYVGFD
ncbi:hypothetical protein PQ469_15985 [Mucilaginibacter sp. KACC 22773]|uniref:hypothetical protein n=1 Tax=Mucilaginibacter sp. KACC 22773 TaxID=3025671 RepID=UPI002365C31C|nr:hypothetical protein [Mucilaginibacter sp. KACC 22773]WDF75391.1 hypothetical protein PQ469_15985 [Mucilaginibacter sp. KACC 22773]